MYNARRYPNFRNVTSRHEQGRLIVEISPVDNWRSYVFGLLLTSVIFLWGSWIFASPIIRPTPKADLTVRLAYFLPAVAFLFVWFFVGAQICLRRLSSIELMVGGGVFKWTQRTFRWTKVISVPEENVTAVVEEAKWYRNELRLKMNGTSYAVDDLLEDDLKLLARELRRRLAWQAHTLTGRLSSAGVLNAPAKP